MRDAIACSTTGPKIVSTATSANAKPITAAIFSATRRFRTKDRPSLRWYARLSASMYAFIAPVTDQAASMNPTIVIAMLELGFASARLSELSSSSVAWAGMTPCSCCITFVIVSGPAMSVKRPVATIRVDGIAKNEL